MADFFFVGSEKVWISDPGFNEKKKQKVKKSVVFVVFVVF